VVLADDMTVILSDCPHASCDAFSVMQSTGFLSDLIIAPHLPSFSVKGSFYAIDYFDIQFLCIVQMNNNRQ
jgi:hypothetical protein